jgi:hypothetical protein
MKWLTGAYVALFVAGLGGLGYGAIGYYVTLKKIEATCHEALAFKEPTATAKAVCYSHGFYN